MKDWIVTVFVTGWLRDLLNKLPFKGLMSVLGVVVVALGYILQLPLDTSTSAVITLVVQILQGVGAENIQDAGEIALIIGVMRKLLNFWALWKAYRVAHAGEKFGFRAFYTFAMNEWRKAKAEDENDGGWGGAGNPA